MIDLSAFNEHEAMMVGYEEEDNLESVVLITLTKDGVGISTTSHDLEAGYDVYRLIGAIESLKIQLINQHMEVL